MMHATGCILIKGARQEKTATPLFQITTLHSPQHESASSRQLVVCAYCLCIEDEPV